MSSSASPAKIIRFGAYEADPRSGELHKNGLKIRLQEQPFQILMMLLERPGEVVTREQLRLRLWPADTFVDFDHGLNTAINKLRDALGDVASNPRFVETLARRGYRFIAPVTYIEPVPASVTPASPATQTTSPSPAPAPAVVAPTPVETTTADGSAPALPAENVTCSAPLPNAKSEINESELPRPARKLTRGLFALVQIMYVIFYGVALVRLDRIRDITGEYMMIVVPAVLVTAAIGIAVRLYLFTAVTFDFRPLGMKFKRLFPCVLPLDQLWALAPFLLVQQIGIGAAFAACAALLYLPFSERTLIRMAYEYR